MELLQKIRAEGYTVIVDLAAVRIEAAGMVFGPDRDAITRTVCECADAVVFCGRGDTVGLVRLANLLDIPQIAQWDPQLLVNQVSKTASGRSVYRSVRDILAQIGHVKVAIVPFAESIPRDVVRQRPWSTDSELMTTLKQLPVWKQCVAGKG